MFFIANHILSIFSTQKVPTYDWFWSDAPDIDNFLKVTSRDKSCKCHWRLVVYLMLLGSSRPTHDWLWKRNDEMMVMMNHPRLVAYLDDFTFWNYKNELDSNLESSLKFNSASFQAYEKWAPNHYWTFWTLVHVFNNLKYKRPHCTNGFVLFYYFWLLSWVVGEYPTTRSQIYMNECFYNHLLLLLLLLHLVMHPTKCYTNSKVRCSIRKNQLWTSASSSVSQKSQDQLSDPSIQQATHSNSWDQQQQRLSVLWLGTTRSPRTANLKADRPETAEPLVQKATR